MPRPKKPASPFRYFHSAPEVIRMAVMLYVRYGAEAVDSYCEHVLLGKEGRFDFSPWLVPLD